MNEKYQFIREFEQDCVQMPKNLGGRSLSKGGHSVAFGSVRELVGSCNYRHERHIEDGEQIPDKILPGVYGFDFWLTEKDVLAYIKFLSDNADLRQRVNDSWHESGLSGYIDELYKQYDHQTAWDKYHQRQESSEYGQLAGVESDLFKDFAINYLNIAKIGTHSIYGNKCIVTSDPTPHIRFERWIKDGFHIHQLGHLLDFDTEKNEFIRKEPTLMQIIADRNKHDELEEWLGEELPFCNEQIFNHSTFSGTTGTTGQALTDPYELNR